MKKLVTHFGMKIFVLLVLVGCLAQPNFGQAVGLDSTSDWPIVGLLGWNHANDTIYFELLETPEGTSMTLRDPKSGAPRVFISSTRQKPFRDSSRVGRSVRP